MVKMTNNYESKDWFEESIKKIVAEYYWAYESERIQEEIALAKSKANEKQIPITR